MQAEPGLPGWWLVGTLLFMLLATIAALWQSDTFLVGMYANFDGRWAAWNHAELFRWSAPLDLSPFNPLAGLGSIFLPNLPWLNPGAWPLVLEGPRGLPHALSYAVYLVELCGSSWLLFRTIGASRLLATLAIQLAALAYFPPFSMVAGTLAWFSMAPVNAHLMAMCNLGLIALLRLGEGSARRDIGWCGLFAAALISAFYSAPMTVLTYIPVYGLFGIVLLADRRPAPRALARKALLLVAAAAVLLLAGAADYVLATRAVAARAGVEKEFLHAGRALLDPSYWAAKNNLCALGQDRAFLLCPGSDTWLLQGLALLGALLAILWRPRLRATGLGYLVLVGAVHLMALDRRVQALGPLSQINAAFFAWAAIPFQSLFAALPAAWAVQRLMRHQAWLAFPATLLLPVLMVAVWYHVIAPTQPAPVRTGADAAFLPPPAARPPDRSGPIQRILRERIALAPGAVFRGRVATVFGRHGWLEGQAGTDDEPTITLASRLYLARVFGSGFQETDLWAQGIPTFAEYGQWVSRPAQRFSLRLLVDPASPEAARLLPYHTSMLRAYVPDLPVLRMLGVRYLLTDRELPAGLPAPAPILLAEQHAEGAPGPLRLYDLLDANLADYSPTTIRTVETFPESFDWLAGHRGSLVREAVAFTAPAGPLVPAAQSALSFLRDGWRLQARSPGRSVIAVPVQYSACWELDETPAGLRLYRGNGILTFVEFEGQIDIRARLRFGPPGASDCRKQDGVELARRGL